MSESETKINKTIIQHSENNIEIPDGGRADKPWFVLLATDPGRVEYRLAQVNMTEEKAARDAAFSLFVPYTSLGSTKELELSKEHFSLRSALRRYLFVKGEEKRLETLLREWNRTYDDKTFFLRSDREHRSRISERDMQTLKTVCGNEQVRLDMPLLLSEMEKGKQIPLVGTPFDIKDATYKLLDVKRKRGGIVELQVELTLFNVTFQNLYVTYLDPVDANAHATLVATAQRRLLDIFKRRVNGKRTEVTDHEDRKTLQALFAKRDTPFPDGAMKRHFLALMLICAQLLADEEGTAHFMAEVRSELADISKLRESKAATDTRAYLHIALYIATGEPQYRQLAKTYVQKYNPTSPYLCQFVATASKRQAGKHLGPRARR